MSTILRVRAEWTGPSAPLLSTLYYTGNPGTQIKADAAFSNMATLLNSIRDQVTLGFSYAVSQDVVEIEALTGVQVARWTVTNVAAAAGQNVGDPLPFQTQGMINWRTGVFAFGREIRGRFYLPGPSETSNTAGLPLAAYITDLNAAAAVAVADTNAELVVWSRKNGAAPPATAGLTATGWRVLRSRR